MCKDTPALRPYCVPTHPQARELELAQLRDTKRKQRARITKLESQVGLPLPLFPRAI